MGAAFKLLAARDSYRDDRAAGGGVQARAGRHLGTANDALQLAILTLGSSPEDGRGEKLRRAEHARGFLVEAVTALSRARIYVPGIRTHAVPFMMAVEPDADAELSRLYHIATRLAWQNHAYLPARRPAKPLPPEEEAQLAVVFDGLARNARIERVLRYKWAGFALAVAGAGAVVGYPVLGTLAALGGLMLGVVRATRIRQRAQAT